MREWWNRYGGGFLFDAPLHTYDRSPTDRGRSAQSTTGQTHRRYSRMINFREDWRDSVWQGRVSSYVIDERYLLTELRSIELYPVRAGLLKDPAPNPWSSASAHNKRRDDTPVSVSPL